MRERHIVHGWPRPARFPRLWRPPDPADHQLSRLGAATWPERCRPRRGQRKPDAAARGWTKAVAWSVGEEPRVRSFSSERTVVSPSCLHLAARRGRSGQRQGRPHGAGARRRQMLMTAVKTGASAQRRPLSCLRRLGAHHVRSQGELPSEHRVIGPWFYVTSAQKINGRAARERVICVRDHELAGSRFMTSPESRSGRRPSKRG